MGTKRNGENYKELEIIDSHSFKKSECREELNKLAKTDLYADYRYDKKIYSSIFLVCSFAHAADDEIYLFDVGQCSSHLIVLGDKKEKEEDSPNRIGVLYDSGSASQNNPQYKDNEDIVFGYFKNQTIPYNQGNINVSYESIRNIVYNFQNGERYFVMGYPGCKHYSKRVNDYNLNQALQNKIGRNVVQDLGLSPLIVTSQTATAFLSCLCLDIIMVLLNMAPRMLKE